MTTGLDVAGFLHADGSLRILFDLMMIGVFGGFFLVPLFALVQSRTPKSELSRVIAGNNILNAVFIVAAAVCGIAAQQLPAAGASRSSSLRWRSLNALVAVYIFTLVPEFLMRFLQLAAGEGAVPAARRRHREHPRRGPGDRGLQPRQLHGRADPGAAPFRARCAS